MPTYPEFVTTKTVTIATGTSLSAASADLKGTRVLAVIPDAAWDTQAMTFQVSNDGTNWFNLFQESVEYSLTGVVASNAYQLSLMAMLPWRYIKVRSGTSGVPANQVGDTVVTLVLSPI